MVVKGLGEYGLLVNSMNVPSAPCPPAGVIDCEPDVQWTPKAVPANTHPWTWCSCPERRWLVLYLRSDLIEMLRSMAQRGEQPSALLRTLVAQLGPETADRPLLVRYFSTAFCFTEGQGYKIFGWFPDGTGALRDADLDSLLSKRIQGSRAEWDKPGPDSENKLPTVSVVTKEGEAQLGHGRSRS